MSYRTGIIAAEDGKTIDDVPQAYRSDYGHLKIDSRASAKHMGIIDTKVNVPTRTVNGGADALFEDVFYTLEHHLPFIPRASIYMLVRDANPTLAASIGRYYGGNIGIQPFGFINEGVFMRVNDKTIQLVRRLEAFNAGFPGTSFQSIMQDTLIRAKYMIFSNEAADTPYDTRLPYI